MVTIKFSGSLENEERGLRIIVTSGRVEYTATRGVYRIPSHVAEILTKEGIPFVNVITGEKNP